MILSRPFETENKQSENKNRAAGIIVTIAVHALLLLGLYFLFITPPDPPFEDNAGGMTVNYGTSDVGTGDQQQFTAVPVKVATEQENTPTPKPEVASSAENLETQDNEDAAVIQKKVEVKKPKVKPNPDATYKPTAKPVASATPVTPQPTVDKNALFTPGAPGKPNNSKGDGEGKGKGDQGDPNGDPNSKNYHGGGHGNGNGVGEGNGPGGNGPGNGPSNVRLSGRKIKAKPRFSYDCDAKGKVVMNIKVNKSGRVVGADFTQSGSTTADDCLIARARQLALEYTFDDNAAAADVQQGSISFDFREH